jgi:hypothetical protein
MLAAPWLFLRGGSTAAQLSEMPAGGPAANLGKDAIYPYTEADGTGTALSGANKYIVKFARGSTPPASGFWSITMCEIDKGLWFSPNALNKFTVSERDNLKPSADGSISLYVQNESPGNEEGATARACARMDADRNYRDGQKNYRVHRPPYIPVKTFWSIIPYDTQTRSLLQTDQRDTALICESGTVKGNADGSVDVYFGPTARAGRPEQISLRDAVLRGSHAGKATA